jgi:protein required for attachment to host cells
LIFLNFARSICRACFSRRTPAARAAYQRPLELRNLDLNQTGGGTPDAHQISKKESVTMKIPANALILVADGRKAMILVNAGGDKFPNLKVEWSATEQNPSTSSQGTDKPGRVQFKDHHSSVEQTDWHQQQEVDFAKRVGAVLEEFARARRAHGIVIISPPRTLAILRRNLSNTSGIRIIAELPRDLVNHTIDDIEAFLLHANAGS